MATDEKRAKRTASHPQKLPNRRIKQLSPERVTLTPHESTRITGFGIQATYKMLNEGKLPSIKVGARFYIPRAALARFMETCGGAAA
jgi:excisionase family DNA binding protein